MYTLMTSYGLEDDQQHFILHIKSINNNYFYNYTRTHYKIDRHKSNLYIVYKILSIYTTKNKYLRNNLYLYITVILIYIYI